MVALASPDLFKFRPVCLSRLYLYRAHSALERGDTIAAGCLLREAVTRYLTALCQYGDCLPRKRDRTPANMLRVLREAHQLGDDDCEAIRMVIDVGNKLAHCKAVRPSRVEYYIHYLNELCDATPELVYPTREGIGGTL